MDISQANVHMLQMPVASNVTSVVNTVTQLRIARMYALNVIDRDTLIRNVHKELSVATVVELVMSLHNVRAA